MERARVFLNDYVTPSEFMGMTIYEDEHPLMEREAENGKRNVIIYHTAGSKVAPIKELREDLVGDIYTFHKFEVPEDKDWENLYNQVVEKMNGSGQSTGQFVSTATTSDD